MRAIVTGGAGFIGSHLADRLLNDGAERVLVIDDLSSGLESNVPAGADLERIDATDARINEVVRSFAPEIIFHLAAQPSVVVSVRDPLLDARVNVLGAINVCEAAVAAGVRKVVVASSGGTVYGDPEPTALPVPETYAGIPSSPYGISKGVIHQYLAFYKSVHGLDYTALALANVYGPRQDPHGEAGVVAIWSENMLAGKECLLFGDGEQTRDFVYVADVVDAFSRAGSAGGGEVINVGTGVQTTINTLYAAIAAALRLSGPPVYQPPRPGELRHISLDVRKAKRELGWEPFTSLDDGIAATTSWFSEKR